ncbi:hypothetical protein QFC20_007260 [Naganishia adeliensis]|uniref:Uncharacterized protein n=1 Tax=Naganishia adeliensis TaxID=92952 RepID=A0ACC2V1E2_9TREE|nr:hypothetical protein QFC20_007260 [Naganishia adeliensis]
MPPRSPRIKIEEEEHLYGPGIDANAPVDPNQRTGFHLLKHRWDERETPPPPSYDPGSLDSVPHFPPSVVTYSANSDRPQSSNIETGDGSSGSPDSLYDEPTAPSSNGPAASLDSQTGGGQIQASMTPASASPNASPTERLSDTSIRTTRATSAHSGSFREGSIISRPPPSSAHDSAASEGELGILWGVRQDIGGTTWAIGTPHEGNGTRFKIGVDVDSETGKVIRLITLPERPVTQDIVKGHLPRARDREFWRPSGVDQRILLDYVSGWIVGIQRAFWTRVQPGLERQQHPSSAGPSHGFQSEVTPYSTNEPVREMGAAIKRRQKNIGVLYWKVCTTNGETFEVGWKYNTGTHYTTCIVTIGEGVTEKEHIRSKFPPYGDKRFWHARQLITNDAYEEQHKTTGLLAAMIINLRKTEYGMSASTR